LGGRKLFVSYIFSRCLGHRDRSHRHTASISNRFINSLSSRPEHGPSSR
jgi:hypothetical protein